MPDTHVDATTLKTRGRFEDPLVTAQGDVRAHVSLVALKTLWFNTGSLCNIACENCYIESSPRNDRLAYLAAAEVARFLDEAERLQLPLEQIGFTGGEPFLNREFPDMLRDSLRRGYRVLVLTNATKPLQQRREKLLALSAEERDRLTLRVSIDHYRAERHESIRGKGNWQPSLAGLIWLAANGFRVHVAGRTCWEETEGELRNGFAELFRRNGIGIDAADPEQLVLFPEMDRKQSPPEITVGCWEILGRSPVEMMCATSRMVIKRRGASDPVVVPCTLLPYDAQFELGGTLGDARPTVYLNHPFCAQFCVLGGASCASRSNG